MARLHRLAKRSTRTRNSRSCRASSKTFSAASSVTLWLWITRTVTLSLASNTFKLTGKFADGAIGVFNGSAKYLAVLEGKGPLDPLDRPFAGRKMSAVDQGFRYAINLKCDWVIVTNLKEIRLYHKGNDFAHFEQFETARLAGDRAVLQAIPLLAERRSRRLAADGCDCHLPELLSDTEPHRPAGDRGILRPIRRHPPKRALRSSLHGEPQHSCRKPRKS